MSDTNTVKESGPAWRAAKEAGVDESLLQASLLRSPSERVQVHKIALNTILALRESVKLNNSHG